VNPNRVDFLVDLAYGVLLFLSIVLILTVGTVAGIMFGLGALISYVVHVVWKMSRFDPAWMTEEITENIEETLTEEVTENVEEQVTEEVAETLSAEIAAIIDQLEAVNERVDRRPHAAEIEDPVGGVADGDEADAEADRSNAEPSGNDR